MQGEEIEEEEGMKGMLGEFLGKEVGAGMGDEQIGNIEGIEDNLTGFTFKFVILCQQKI